MFIGKYYKSSLIQIIIGCSCYIISLLIISEFVSTTLYETYKYNIFILMLMDMCFMIYNIRYSEKEVKDQTTYFVKPKEHIENSVTDIDVHKSAMLSSDHNMKITHEQTSSIDNKSYDLFSVTRTTETAKSGESAKSEKSEKSEKTEKNF